MDGNKDEAIKGLENIKNSMPCLRGRTLVSSSSEHHSVIREIRRKKDFYKMLGLKKNCSSKDIRKAYRKLSLKVHPDKNRVPGAEDSFKIVSKAFECLSNEESRRKYDLMSISMEKNTSTIIMVTFGVNASVAFVFRQPWTMKMLTAIVRDRAEMFNLSGSFRLKYEYEGRMVYLPKEEEYDQYEGNMILLPKEEDDLEADDELRNCIERLTSLGENMPIRMWVEFI